jgi:hypothetical protein
MSIRPATVLSASALVLATSTPPAAAQRDQGQVTCQVLDNGSPASGTMSVQAGGREVAEGSCGVPLRLPQGRYRVDVQLDGALDNPTKSQAVRVLAGKAAHVEAGFATGTLRVVVNAAGRRAAAMALIYRDGRRIGTLGSGVTAHLSAGRYAVVVRHRTDERRFDDVHVAQGRTRTLDVSFP